MNTKELITLVQLTRGANVVGAMYMTNDKPGAVYHFKNVIGATIVVGDFIVVQSRDTYALVKVVSVDVSPHELPCTMEALKHVVAVVNLKPINNVLAAEAKAAVELNMSELHTRLMQLQNQIGEAGFTKATALLTMGSYDGDVVAADEIVVEGIK